MLAWLGVGVACLGLSVITTVLIAWAFVLHGTCLGGVRVNANDGTLWTHTSWIGPHRAHYELWWDYGPDRTQERVLPKPAFVATALPNWVRLPERHAPKSPFMYRVCASGWPALSFYGVEILEVDKSKPHDESNPYAYETTRFGVVQGPLDAAEGRAPLPLRPIWPAFALEAVAFSLPWMLLVLGARLISRKRRRMRRGHCPMCAYDLSGDLASGCPECGWLRTLSAGGRRRRVRWRTLAWRSLGYAVGGVALTCVVAIVGAVVGVTHRDGSPQQEEQVGWGWTQTEGPAYAVHYVYERSRIEDGRNPTAGGNKVSRPNVPAPDLRKLRAPGWAIVPQFENWSAVTFFGAGWPLTSFTATRVWKLTLPARTGLLTPATFWWQSTMPAHGVTLGHHSTSPYDEPYGGVTPLTPVCPGLLLDTAFYAVVLFVFVRLWRALSRVLWPMPAWTTKPAAAAPASSPACGGDPS